MEEKVSRNTGGFLLLIDVVHIPLDHVHEIRILMKMPVGFPGFIIVFGQDNAVHANFRSHVSVVIAFGENFHLVSSNAISSSFVGLVTRYVF